MSFRLNWYEYSFSFWSALVVGLVHYLLYLASAFFRSDMTVNYAIYTLLSGGFFFVFMTYNSWLWWSVILTPFIVLLAKRKETTWKLILINTLIGLIITPIVIFCFLICHMVIGTLKLAI